MSLLCKSDNPINGMKFGKLLLYVTLINEKITLDIRLFNIFFLTLENKKVGYDALIGYKE